MTDGPKPPERPSTPSRPSSPSTPPAQRALSAERTTPLPAAPAPAGSGAQARRLAGGAQEAALNLAGLLRDAVADFRRRDRFFKYKAAIVAAWVVLSVASVAVGWPRSALSAGRLGARLVLNTQVRPPIVMLLNEGREPWDDVTVIVNGRYRASPGRVQPGGSITLTPKQLMGDNGVLAPSDLAIRDLALRTREGQVTLLEAGEEP